MTLLGADLKIKALLALEEISQDCRYCIPRRTHAVRFALAYLWTLSEGDPAPFRQFWNELANWNELVRWRQTDTALGRIYAAVGAKRDDDVSGIMWRVAQAEHEKRRALMKQHGVRD